MNDYYRAQRVIGETLEAYIVKRLLPEHEAAARVTEHDERAPTSLASNSETLQCPAS